MTKKFRLAWFGSAGFGGDADTWQWTTQGYDWRYPELYQDTARALERAKFDMMSFADTIALPQVYQGRWDHYLRTGMWYMHDPIPYASVVAATTRHLGVVATISTSLFPPFMAARLLATLDHLSRGRAGINLVTSMQKLAAQNFGLEDLLDHDERYNVADEYIDLCRKLWNSWDHDALVLDRNTETFADSSKVHAVNFESAHYKSKGPLTVSPSPQQTPLVISAGASPRGARFAAEHAEVTVISKSNVKDMKAFSNGLQTRLAEAGRKPGACKILNLFRPIVGETDSIAHEKWEAQASKIRLETGLATMSEQFGYDMAQFDPDKPLPSDLRVNALRSRFDDYYKNANPTLREVAAQVARNEGFPVVGTPSHIADVLEDASENGGIDGFMTRIPLHDYSGLIEFIDKVIPELQRRGLVRSEYKGPLLRDHMFEF